MKIIFADTAAFAVPFLQSLINSEHEVCAVYTQPDRPAGRGLKLQASSVKECAQQNGLLVLQPESLDSADVLATMRAFNADAMVDVAYGLLIPEAVLQMFRFDCVNVHPSLLPRWRGAAPIERAILAGDAVTGVTIMLVDAGWDTGDILTQVELPILADDTAATLSVKLQEVGERLLQNTLRDLGFGKIVPQKQDDAQSCYAKKLTKEAAAIAWSAEAVNIERQVRAFIPRLVAYSLLQGERVKIWRAQVVLGVEKGLPGEIVAAGKDGIDVATGNGILRILELQLPGGKILTAKQILNSKSEFFKVGNKFDA